MNPIYLVGLLAGLCFALCGVPAAIATIRAGRSVGTPVFVAWMICLGTVLAYIYLTVLHGLDFVITANYSVEFGAWVVIVKYHYLPSRSWCGRCTNAQERFGGHMTEEQTKSYHHHVCENNP